MERLTMLRTLVLLCVLLVKFGTSQEMLFDELENLAVELAKKELNKTDAEQMKTLDQLVDYFSPLMRKIDDYESLFKKKSIYLPTNAMRHYHEVLKDFPELEEKLQKNFDKIDELFQYFRESLRHLKSRKHTPEGLQRITDVQRRLTIIIDDKYSGLQNILSMVDWFVQYEIKSKTNYDSLFSPLAENMRVNDDKFCGKDLSPHQILWATYEYIAIADIKGFVLLDLCFNLHSFYTHTLFTENIKTQATEFIKRRQRLDDAITRELPKTPRYLRACNPEPYVRDRDYIELEGLYGPYLINELHMNITYKPETLYPEDFYFWLRWAVPITYSAAFEYYMKYSHCRNTCPQVNSVAIRVTESTEDFPGIYKPWHNSNLCHGSIYGCDYLDNTVRVCEIPTQDGRRYKYIAKSLPFFTSLTTGKHFEVYGPDFDCSQGRIHDTHAFTANVIDRCDYCLCKCHNSDDDAPNVIKWISLNDYLSNFRLNRVITGVKFVNNGTKIDLQIKQGFLMERGKIVRSEWISPVSNNSKYLEIGEVNSKSLILADYEAPSGQVVTGIRFKHYFGEYFGIQIHCTVFNYTTGLLDYKRSYWMDTIDSSKLRDEVLYDQPDNPASSSNIRVNSKPNQYVKFQLSDLKKTAEAYVIPFFDIQKVETDGGFPLSGISLVHKGDKGYGGFVVLQIKTYEFTKHIAMYHKTSEKSSVCTSCVKRFNLLPRFFRDPRLHF